MTYRDCGVDCQVDFEVFLKITGSDDTGFFRSKSKKKEKAFY